ncbi:MAG: hypothetical protein V1735_00980 [Nanoarchaeota archaeon]
MKRGYFYSIDAFLAVSVLIFGLSFIFFSQPVRFATEPSKNIADDTLNTLAATKIYQFNDLAYPVLRLLKSDGLVPDVRMTLLEEATYLWFIDHDDNATAFLTDTINRTIPPQFQVHILINGTVLLNRSTSQAKDADFLMASRQIVYGTVNKTQLFGPFTAEVWVWQ